MVHDIARSEAPSMLKEVALYTMELLAKSNVLCEQSLRTHKLFDEMMLFIVDEKSSMRLQTRSVSLLLALVSKNSVGQMLLRETGCLSILQKFFRETLTKSEIDSSNESFEEKYLLWYRVCKTLGAAVNNPQNEENQKICCSTLSHVQTLLEGCVKPEIIHPLCLFIGLSVAGNPPVQKFFTYLGGLDVLADIFTKLVGDSHQNISNTKMAVTVTIAMEACIANNPPGSIVLGKHHIVPKLLTLLFLENLDSEEKTLVLITLGCCIESCEESLCLLLQNNGLELIVDSLSESHSEIVSIVVSIVQHKCKIFADKLLIQLLAHVLQEISAMENEGQALGCLKKTKITPFKREYKVNPKIPEGGVEAKVATILTTVKKLRNH
ncbi:telomere repeats-binding bouquet formation protein 1-like isoform X2 [Tachyglossus aculeatus]|uniref:telomere repeats-binding bouquet formation protein 1-like isoform X2 n=1 Tax=Tachyglossus aculeatus TaxID=9261 RepID=UPI0018F58527|nr:telomere repeats-binding bouquet formation protein 1-like isoform X2 [Tachyglossus aculeatus]